MWVSRWEVFTEFLSVTARGTPTSCWGRLTADHVVPFGMCCRAECMYHRGHKGFKGIVLAYCMSRSCIDPKGFGDVSGWSGEGETCVCRIPSLTMLLLSSLPKAICAYCLKESPPRLL